MGESASRRSETLPPRIRDLAIAGLGRVSGLWLRTPAGRPDLLRILAYHGIEDPSAFELQLRHLNETYQPITADDVLDALTGSRLPQRAVWVTFDDGDPSVVVQGLAALNRYGIEATLFVCPRYIDTSEPYWWQVVDAATEAGISYRDNPVNAETRLHLKRIPDPERRHTVRQIRDLLEAELDRPFTGPQLKSSQLEDWVMAGHRVGNHTWDHPLLDQCDPDQQEEQIVAAHEDLSDRLGERPVLFAYPNGNWSQAAEDVLTRLGYRAAVLFDHRLTSPVDSLRLSRLRTGADADIDRFRAIVSGVHPFLYQFRLARDSSG